MSSNKSEALARGVLFLDATVDKVFSIAPMYTGLTQSQDFTKTTRLRYGYAEPYIIFFMLAILAHARQVKSGENQA